MKKKMFFITLTATFLLAAANAQVPDGYSSGTISLANGNTLSGYIKDNIKKNAAVIYLNAAGSEKKVYNSTEINAVQIGNTHFISVKGDFFKAVCSGKMSFLQKASNAAGKTIYNGSEAIVLPGTEGKIGDYFTYTDGDLTMINTTSIDTFIQQLGNCATAVEKAKTANGEPAVLAEAVAIYNANNQ